MKEGSIDLRGLALVVVAGSWLVGILCGSLVELPALLLLICAGLLLLCTVLVWHCRWARLLLCFTLCLLLGAWRYTLASPASDPQAISKFINTGVVQVQGRVSEEPRLQGRSRKIIVAVEKVSIDSGRSWMRSSGKLSAQLRGVLLEAPYGPNYSDEVQLQGKLQPQSPYDPPGVFASMAFPRVSVKNSAQDPLIAALYHFRNVLAESIARALPQPKAALLSAILLSLRTPALKPLTDAFNATGTAHLIAPSGYKVTIFAGIISNFVRSFFPMLRTRQRLLPRQKRAGWQAWLVSAVVVTGIMLYTLINGAGPAALRAGIMGIVLALAPRLGRVYNVYTAMALTALLMSSADPFVLWDAGFQLSFLGTLGIILLTPHFQRRLRAIERIPGGHYVAETVAVTMAAQVATLPIFAITFHEISLIAPLPNLLVMPLLGTMLLLGMLLCCSGFIFAPLGLLWGWIATPLLWYMIAVVTWCANLQFAVIPVGEMSPILAWGYYALLIVCGSLLWHGKTAALSTTKQPVPAQAPIHDTASALLSKRVWRIVQISLAMLIVIATGGSALSVRTHGPLRITFLAVGTTKQPGHGEAVLITTPDGKTVLVDGGPDSTSLSQTLDAQLPAWQRSLDAVILTTARADHISGLLDVVSRYTIGEVIDAGMLHPTTTYALWRRIISEHQLQYVSAQQGTTIPIGTEMLLQVLWPPVSLHKGGNEARDNALMLRLVTRYGSVLLLGVGAQSRYALAGLVTGVNINYLRASIVQVVSDDVTAFPGELAGVLQQAQPSMLVITPDMVTARQRAASGQPAQRTQASQMMPVSLLASSSAWQVVQTGQEEGSVEITIEQGGYSVNSV